MSNTSVIVSNWTHYVEDVQFSVQHFYAILEEAIIGLQLPGVSIHSLSLVEESSFFQKTKREHFQVYIEPQGTSFIIYAAPLSRFFFFSVKCIRDTEMYKYATSYQPDKSFYAADAASLTETIVNDCISDVINRLFNEKGVRPPNLNQQPFHSSTE